MPAATPAVRERSDLCPGALRSFEASDGLIARVRKPGGRLSAPQLRVLAGVAVDLGDGHVELTSRGNLQVRALSSEGAGEFAQRVADAGLLPSVSHERVRNVIASPLSGLDRSADLAPLVEALDAALCERPRLAELSGRFLFALDDGRGDVARVGADITLVACDERATVETLDVPMTDAVATVVALAEAFLDERAAQDSRAWRVKELHEGRARVAARARAALSGRDVRDAARRLPPVVAEPVGPIAQSDGGTALCVLAPLGRLTADQASLLADHAGSRGVRVTPWRSVIVPDLDQPGELAAAAAASGLGVDSASPWYRVSACTGLPGCAKSHADVRTDAQEAATRWRARRVHWSGCERRCGRPADIEVDVVATAEGYVISE